MNDQIVDEAYEDGLSLSNSPKKATKKRVIDDDSDMSEDCYIPDMMKSQKS